MEKHNDAGIRDFFIFYRSFYEAVDRLSNASQLRLYRALVRYSLDYSENEPELKTASEYAVWRMMVATIESNWKKHFSGKKSGAKPGNQNARKYKKEAKEPTEEPTVNDSHDENKTDGKRTENGRTANNKQITNNNEEITNNKEQEKNNTTTTTTTTQKEEKSGRADARMELEKFENEIFNNQIKKEGLCYSLKIDSETYESLAREVLTDWQVVGVGVDSINWYHFMNTMRIKAVARAKAQAQPSGRRSIAEIRQHRDEQAAAIIAEMFGPNSGVPYK